MYASPEGRAVDESELSVCRDGLVGWKTAQLFHADGPAPSRRLIEKRFARFPYDAALAAT